MLSWREVFTPAKNSCGRWRARRPLVMEVLERRDCPSAPPGSAPVANPDAFGFSQNGVVAVAAAGVLVNDFDADSDPLSAVLNTGPAHGTVDLLSDGSFTYTAADQFVGDDSFLYHAVAGGMDSEPALVQVHIALAAVASDPLSVDEGQTVSGVLASVLLADANADPSDFEATIDWGDGSVSAGQIAASGSGILSVSGQHDYAGNGTRSAEITVVKAGGSSSTAQTTINVNNLAPTLTLGLDYGAQRMVTLSGVVSDLAPGGLTVTFTGKVSGTTTTAGDGSFSFTAEASGLGDIQATVVDADGAVSDAAVVTVESDAPIILNFTANHHELCWTFQGTVMDESAMGLTITFGGLPSLSTQQTTVNADGSFTLTIALQADESGMATALVTDWWGLQSEIAETFVAP